MQIVISTLVILGLGKFFDLSLGLSLTLGFSIALSSTAVAIKMLESIGETKTDAGQLAIGILVAQDLAVVPLMMIIKGLQHGSFNYSVGLTVLVSTGLLAALIWVLLRKQNFRLPLSHLYGRNADLQSLLAMLCCFGMASVAGLLGLSAAYGAFIGGLIVGNSDQRELLLRSAKPIQSVLMVFFVSVGLLLDFQFIWDHLYKVITILLFVTVGKTIANICILHFLKQPWNNSFLAGLVVSQVGEFAFILATLGADIQIIDAQGKQLIVSLAALSLVTSPLWLIAARRLHDQGLCPRKQRLINCFIQPVDSL